jgi:AcrR family transcriptional regulator
VASDRATAEPSEGRRERKKRQLRERILDEASGLIAERGLPATTIDDIADRVDISQSTFFNYFHTKTSLVEALVARIVDQWNDLVQQAHATDSRTQDKVTALFRMSADLTEDQHRLLRALVAETFRAPADNASDGLNNMRALFCADIADGQDRGEVRTDYDPATLADAVLGLYSSVLLFWTTEADYPVAQRLRDAGALAVQLLEPVRSP